MRKSLHRPLVVAVLCWMDLAASPLVLADEPKTAANHAQVTAFQKAAPNNDRKVSRKEARRFVEIPLGIRRSDGKLKTRATNKVQIAEDSAWHPGGERVIFAMHCPERKRLQFYEFHPKTDDPPKLLKGQDADRSNSSACWTPDGKRLIVVSVAD